MKTERLLSTIVGQYPLAGGVTGSPLPYAGAFGLFSLETLFWVVGGGGLLWKKGWNRDYATALLAVLVLHPPALAAILWSASCSW